LPLEVFIMKIDNKESYLEKLRELNGSIKDDTFVRASDFAQPPESLTIARSLSGAEMNDTEMVEL